MSTIKMSPEICDTFLGKGGRNDSGDTGNERQRTQEIGCDGAVAAGRDAAEGGCMADESVGAPGDPDQAAFREEGGCGIGSPVPGYGFAPPQEGRFQEPGAGRVPEALPGLRSHAGGREDGGVRGDR